jgi:hypothetical protein
MANLVDVRRLNPGAVIAPIGTDSPHLAEIVGDGEVQLIGEMLDSPSQAVTKFPYVAIVGWGYWALPAEDDGLIPLRHLAAFVTQN